MTMVADDNFLIDDDDVAGAPVAAARDPWRILIVDDDAEVHAVTRLSLRRLSFEGRPVELISAYSASEARALLVTTSDLALILLDVVMETEDAGLRLVRHVRQTLGNRAVRIILRTGQPGSAPEQQVIVDFDINDYRAKTELTHERLMVCTITALRSYRDIRTVEANTQALQHIAEFAAGMFRSDLMHHFLDYMLGRAVAMIEAGGGAGTTEGALFCARQTDHVSLAPETSVVAGCGCFKGAVGRRLEEVLGEDGAGAVEDAITTDLRYAVGPGRIILTVQARGRWTGAAIIAVTKPPAGSLAALVEVFITIATAALDNVYLMEELRRSNKATVVALADLAENRDTDTGEHVLRVARLTGEIARELERCGHPEITDRLFVEQVGLASMLHDLGKVGIPDDILRKNNRLDSDERAVMETHTLLGGRTLDKARKVVPDSCYLTLGWEIATGHHEAFDGTGYPNRLKGTEIALSARIVSVADVFDALTSHRSYKRAWPLADAIAYVVDRRGRQFDPAVVDAFLAVIAARSSEVRIRWTEEMSVGHAGIDNDHRMLIDLINQLAAAERGNDRASAEFVIDELIQYTMLHFAREEEVLERLGYPDLARHMASHFALARQVMALRERFANGLSGRLSSEILDFLSGWLSNHILREDMLYAPQIRAAGAAGAAGATIDAAAP